MKTNNVPSLLTGESIIDVQKIEVIGLDRTRLSFFERELKDASIISRDDGTSLTLQKNAIIIDNKARKFDKLDLASLLSKEKALPTLRNVHSALHQFTSKMVASDLFEFVDTNLQVDDSTSNRFPVRIFIRPLISVCF